MVTMPVHLRLSAYSNPPERNSIARVPILRRSWPRSRRNSPLVSALRSGGSRRTWVQVRRSIPGARACTPTLPRSPSPGGSIGRQLSITTGARLALPWSSTGVVAPTSSISITCAPGSNTRRSLSTPSSWLRRVRTMVAWPGTGRYGLESRTARSTPRSWLLCVWRKPSIPGVSVSPGVSQSAPPATTATC